MENVAILPAPAEGPADPKLYPDIGDLTPRELAERNTYGYVPSRGEAAPGAPSPAAYPQAAPGGLGYSPQLDEIITALAALSRQAQALTAEVRRIHGALRGEDGPGTPREAEASRPYLPPPPPDPGEGEEDAYMSANAAAMRLGCSKSHVKRIPGLRYVKRGPRILFTRESVMAEAARRGADARRRREGTKPKTPSKR